MAGAKPLRKLQLGREASSTPGTEVNASSYWRGVGVLEDLRETKVVEEDVGILVGVDRNTIPKLDAQLALDDVECSYEQILYVLDAGITAASASADGTGSGHIWVYPFPTTAAGTPRTYTFEGGDNAAAELMTYAFVEEFTISGAGGEPLMISSNWRGRTVSTGAYTTAVSIPSVTDMLFGNCKLYIDSTTGTIGTTQVTSQFLGFNLNMVTGFIPVWTGDGNTYFTFMKMSRPETICEITLEHDTAAIAEKAIWRAGTSRQIRIKCEGPALTTPSTSYTKKTLIIDMLGRWDKFGGLEDQDDDDIVTGAFRVLYVPGKASAGEITVVNELAAIP